MNEEKINQLLRQEIEDETPDTLNDLMAEIDAQEENRPRTASAGAGQRKGRAAKRTWKPVLRLAVLAAAVIAVVLIGKNVLSRHGGSEQASGGAVLAAVMLDVNPSVKMEINEEERVVSATGLNDEGKQILKKMDLTGSDVTVASYAVIGGMLANGYLSDETNSVLVSVTSDEKGRGEEIEKRLSEDLSSYLENSSIGAAIIGQYVKGDEKVASFAKSNDISEGKAWIIKELAASHERQTEESLLKLSTQELLLLWTNAKSAGEQAKTAGNAKDAGSTLYGKVSTNRYITKKKAIDVALDYVGITRGQAESVEVEFDCDDGVIIYEVEFASDGREYEVEVQAATGTVISGGPGENGTLVGTPTSGGYDDDDDDLYESDDDSDDDDQYESDDEDDDDLYESDDDNDDD